jgi:hypothetical protein
MDNQFSASDISVSNIAVLSNVKEVVSVKKSYLGIFALIFMIVFAGLLVFLSVYKFDTTVKPQVAHATSSYNNQVQQLTR